MSRDENPKQFLKITNVLKDLNLTKFNTNYPYIGKKIKNSKLKKLFETNKSTGDRNRCKFAIIA